MTQVTLDPREGGRSSPLAGGLSGQMIGRAVGDAFVKLNPVKLIKNPVIFTTWIVALLSTLVSVLIGVAWGATADVLTPANWQRALHMQEPFDDGAEVCHAAPTLHAHGATA